MHSSDNPPLRWERRFPERQSLPTALALYIELSRPGRLREEGQRRDLAAGWLDWRGVFFGSIYS